MNEKYVYSVILSVVGVCYVAYFGINHPEYFNFLQNEVASEFDIETQWELYLTKEEHNEFLLYRNMITPYYKFEGGPPTVEAMADLVYTRCGNLPLTEDDLKNWYDEIVKEDVGIAIPRLIGLKIKAVERYSNEKDLQIAKK